MDRPRRVVQKPVTYWDEYVVSDAWYTAALIEDVPADELFAAVLDDDFGDDNILTDEEQSDDASDEDDSEGSSDGERGTAEVLGTREGEPGGEGPDVSAAPGTVQ